MTKSTKYELAKGITTSVTAGAAGGVVYTVLDSIGRSAHFPKGLQLLWDIGCGTLSVFTEVKMMEFTDNSFDEVAKLITDTKELISSTKAQFQTFKEFQQRGNANEVPFQDVKTDH